MNSSEKKQKLIQELISLHEKMSVERLIGYSRQQDAQDWLAEVAAIFKNLDDGDHQEIVRLSKTINPTENRIKRTQAAHEIYNFVRRKIAEYKRYDFNAEESPPPSSKIYPKLMFGEAGRNGQPGGGGSVFIQAEHFNITGGGRISADGGDYIVNDNSTKGDNSPVHINYGTINESTAEAIENITKVMVLVGKSQLEEKEKQQIIGNAEIVKASLIQPEPDKTVLQKAWDGMQVASTIAGAAQLIQMVGAIVIPLLK